MKLYGSPTSPYVRLCRVAAAIRGLDLPLEPVDPYADASFRKVNPMAKVPALVLEDGAVIPDSGAILRYLDEQGSLPSLYARGGLARWRTDALVALATGVLDLGVAWFLEERRPASERSAHWQARRREGVVAGLGAMGEAAKGMPQDAGAADLAFACACDWLAFRQPEVDWRKEAALAERVDRTLAASPFAETDPRRA